jgi:membrane associated rhomboid family serine protease
MIAESPRQRRDIRGKKSRVSSSIHCLIFLLFALPLLLSCFCSKKQFAHAQGDPIYWKRGSHLVASSSSSQPWRNNNPHPRPSSSEPYSRYSQQQQRRRAYRPHEVDIQSIDWTKVQSNRNARIYKPDLKSRRPNQFSITTKIVYMTLACFGLQIFRPSVTEWGMKLSDRILRGEQLYRLVTPIFLHGGIFHLFTNMASLGRMGDVERLFGPGRFLVTYVGAGIAGNVLSAIQSPNPSLGASGAVFGVVGAYFVFLVQNEWLLGDYGHAMTTSIAQTMAMNVMMGLVNPRIDQWAHVGGAIAGGALAYFIGPRLYMTEKPSTDGTFRQMVVDIPVFRAPEYIERIPSIIGVQVDKISSAIGLQADRILPGGASTKPWQDKTFRDQYRPSNGPIRSIRPRAY